jgi:hypothetical protein
MRTLRSRETEVCTSVASGSMTDDQGTTGILSILMSHSHQRLLNRLLVLWEASETSGHMEHEKRQSKYRKT